MATPEEEARWNANWARAWQEASEFERRRYRSLNIGDATSALALMMAGTHSLGEAVKAESGGFEDFLAQRRGE